MELIQAKNVANILKQFDKFINNGGPEIWEYQELDYLIDDLSYLIKSEKVSNSEINELRIRFGDAFSNETMQGFAYNKPYGYSGDFEIIERIYDNYHSSKKSLEKWDFYWQNHPAARAVRNRKEFFKVQLKEIFEEEKGHILNLASGPCTELYEYLNENPNSKLRFDCLDMDKNAIEYSKRKLSNYLQKIEFINQNIFRYFPTKQYNLIWSAGLLDYFDDNTFKKILDRFKLSISNNGVILIGNFDISNKSKNYMEMFDWNLYHRNEEKLYELGVQIFGTEEYEISILSEREKVNLFLKVKKSI